MSVCCENCESTNLKYLAPIRGSLYHAPEAESWECLDCGNIQPFEQDDDDHYKEDDIYT